jgi:hypothetical protein
MREKENEYPGDIVFSPKDKYMQWLVVTQQ